MILSKFNCSFVCSVKLGIITDLGNLLIQKKKKRKKKKMLALFESTQEPEKNKNTSSKKKVLCCTAVSDRKFMSFLLCFHDSLPIWRYF